LGGAVITGVRVEEYLRTSFPDLDREYRDGEIVERSLPTYMHGKVQALLVAVFLALRGKLPVFPCVETRMKIRTGLYLIPDVAVFYQQEPEDVPETPPLVVIEVLSPDDRMTAVLEKLEEYRAWGVRHVWLVDPHSRRMYTWDAGLKEVENLAAVEVGVDLGAAEIFG
jgi:Uma2 family endonuclease